MKKLFVPLFVLVFMAEIAFPQSSRINGDSKYTIEIFGGLNIPRLSSGNSSELSRDFASRSGEIFFDVRGAYGLVAIQKYKQDGSSHNGNLLFDVGYALHF